MIRFSIVQEHETGEYNVVHVCHNAAEAYRKYAALIEHRACHGSRLSLWKYYRKDSKSWKMKLVLSNKAKGASDG